MKNYILKANFCNNCGNILPLIFFHMCCNIHSILLSSVKILLTGNEGERSRPMFLQALTWELPNITTVRAIIRLAWAASSGNLQLLNATPDELHRMHDKNATKLPDGEDVLGMYCDFF